MTIPLFEINPDLDRADLQRRYREHGRVQVRDVLTERTANVIRDILERQVPWGFAWQASDHAPQRMTSDQLAAMPITRRQEIAQVLQQAAGKGDYAFRFNSFAMVEAYLAQANPGSPMDLLVEHLNDQPFLDLVREVTGIPTLFKADAQATLYAGGDFLGLHNDSQVADGWRVAYVLNFAREWKPDWGGYLNFFDDQGDIIEGWRPRFNTLNLFAVPQPHNVGYVPPFAPVGRFAITGWVRDR